MTVILDTLGPIALLITLGWALVRCGFAPRAFFFQTNRLLFYVGLPALLFIKTCRLEGEWTAAGRVLAMLVAGVAACLLVAYTAGRLLKLPPASLGSFLQGAFRGNLAFVGLPVILYALGPATTETKALEGIAVLTLAPLIPLYNLAAVLVLATGGAGNGGTRGSLARKALGRTVTNPLIVACALGLFWNALDWGLPGPIRRAGTVLGQMALPLALIGLGATLRFELLRGHAAAALGAGLIKVGVAPLAGLGISLLLNASAGEMKVGLLYLACPTAVVSFVMAEQLGADGDLAAAIVVVSTLLSVLSFGLVLTAC